MSDEPAPSRAVEPRAVDRFWRAFVAWARARALGRKAAVAIALLSIAAAVATWMAATGAQPFSGDPRVVVRLLYIDIALLLLLGVVVARRLALVWANRRRNLAGARLHGRLALIFGGLAAAPAVLVAGFSYVFLDVVVQGWFDDRVRQALDNSRAVARAYLAEHQSTIRADVLAMAQDLNREFDRGSMTTERLNAVINTQVLLRGLSEALVFNANLGVVGRSDYALALEFEPVPRYAVAEARDGGVAFLTSERDDRVRAIVRLERWGEFYLYVGRLVDSRVLSYLETTEQAVDAYQRLEGQRSGFQLTFVVVFGVLALLLLLVAIWVGLQVATGLAEPIARLVEASERVRGGDLSIRLPERQDDRDEIDLLSRAFNRMTQDIDSQRSALISANAELDDRRQFIETVLEGVTAGVLGVDAGGRVTLANQRAAALLGAPSEALLGRLVEEAAPSLAEPLAEARAAPARPAEAQLRLMVDRRSRILFARVSAEMPPGATEPVGFVVTLDDITELVTAQRAAAWSDVARRIAHEIKNPLTPIQLSAERLKRKYLKEITSDPETFRLCTDTIVRQVGDIGRMVDEFSNFARMPAPVMRTEDPALIAREVIHLQRTARPDVRFDLALPEARTQLRCDARQLRQALLNLLQNAVDAIDGREDAAPPPGEVTVEIAAAPPEVAITVTDNGKGLPRAERERLTEPYVTTRAKGTGLGLAIVQKIMEDHGGELTLDDAPRGGASVRLLFRTGEAAPIGSEAGALRTAAGHGA